ncbi:MAG: hypothetical protein ACYS19_19715, partial [Planctomycetota bacterium]
DLAERRMGAIMAEQALGSIKSTYKLDTHPLCNYACLYNKTGQNRDNPLRHCDHREAISNKL